MNSHQNTNARARRERSREYLTQDEVNKLLLVSKDTSLSRNPERDYCLLLLIWRHGLRVSEACKLKLSDVNLKEKVLHVHGLKSGKSTTHRSTMAK
jgi:type 1 fimbriae regulatory protein FimB